MMAYYNQFAASILINDKPIREVNVKNKRTCYVPFDTEYKIRLKNKHNSRCKVQVYIDGTDVLFGESLVLAPYQSMDLERFLTDLKTGNKFRFTSVATAEKEGSLQDPDNIDNGHIEVKFFKERSIFNIFNDSSPFITTTGSYINYDMGLKTNGFPITTTTCLDMNQMIGSSTSSTQSYNFCSSDKQFEKGVTVEGTQSNQVFTDVPNFECDTLGTTIDIWMVGKEVRKEPKLEKIEVQNKEDVWLGEVYSLIGKDSAAGVIFSNYIQPAFSETVGSTDGCERKVAMEWFSTFLGLVTHNPKLTLGTLPSVASSIFSTYIYPQISNNTKTSIALEYSRSWFVILLKSLS